VFHCGEKKTTARKEITGWISSLFSWFVCHFFCTRAVRSQIIQKLKPHLKVFEKKKVPSWLRVTKEKPDVIVHPKDSVVVQASGTAVVDGFCEFISLRDAEASHLPLVLRLVLWILNLPLLSCNETEEVFYQFVLCINREVMLDPTIFNLKYCNCTSHIIFLGHSVEVFQNFSCYGQVITSGVTDRGARGRTAPPGKINARTGSPLVDILISDWFFVRFSGCFFS